MDDGQSVRVYLVGSTSFDSLSVLLCMSRMAELFVGIDCSSLDGGGVCCVHAYVLDIRLAPQPLYVRVTTIELQSFQLQYRIRSKKQEYVLSPG